MHESIDYTPTGWVARYRNQDGNIEELPVEAWSADHDALVPHEKSGRLMPADRIRTSEFLGIERVDRIVTAIPAAPGWRVRVHSSLGGEHWIDPITAWLVTDQGHIFPILGRSDSGYGETVSSANLPHILGPDDDDDHGLQQQ